jgi:hypothetical protein
MMQVLTRYWATDYDWRNVEAEPNALPQFTTEINGLDIHFIHVKSPHENAMPLIITHGWPGSVIEYPQTVGFGLTDSPVGMAAWMLDHDADHKKIARAFLDARTQSAWPETERRDSNPRPRRDRLRMRSRVAARRGDKRPATRHGQSDCVVPAHSRAVAADHGWASKRLDMKLGELRRRLQ